MSNAPLSSLAAAGTLLGGELLEVSQLSTSVTITATTLSALAADNSFNDSASGFVAAGFAVGDRVKVTGFTGNAANNLVAGKITALTAGKMTIGGTDGDVIVDDAAGESVTIAKWLTRRASVDDLSARFLPKTGGTLTGDLTVPAEAYGVGWDGSNEVPTKNDVYDKMETLAAGGGGTAATLDFDTDGTLAANSDAKLPTQKAVKTFVNAALAGLSWKQAVRAATTAAGTLASSFENGDAVDGVTLATGDRILIKNQATASENGIYTVNASGAPTRATDADSGAELVNASVYVSEGTTNADTQWTCTTDAPITPGTTGLTFAQFISSSYNDEAARDAVGAALTDAGLAVVTVNDGADTIEINVPPAAAADINTGTDNTKAITPDALAGSNFGKAVVTIQVTDPNGSALTTGDGKAYYRVPSALNGMNLVSVAAAVTTASSSGIPTVQIANVTDAVDMLSTKLTIDASETDSSTAATPAAIDTTKDDVATGDMLRIDCDVAGTGTKGLIVEMQFQLP